MSTVSLRAIFTLINKAVIDCRPSPPLMQLPFIWSGETVSVPYEKKHLCALSISQITFGREDNKPNSNLQEQNISYILALDSSFREKLPMHKKRKRILKLTKGYFMFAWLPIWQKIPKSRIRLSTSLCQTWLLAATKCWSETKWWQKASRKYSIEEHISNHQHEIKTWFENI